MKMATFRWALNCAWTIVCLVQLIPATECTLHSNYTKKGFKIYTKTGPASKSHAKGALNPAPWHHPSSSGPVITRKETIVMTQSGELLSPQFPHTGGKIQLPMGETVPDIQLWLISLAVRQRVQPNAFPVKEFKHAIIQIHNRYRHMHDADDLRYDSSLERSAEAWAASLADRHACPDHDPEQKYGQNLFYFSFQYFTDPLSMAEAAVKGFYIEGHDFDYKTFRNYYSAGHFTALVWRATKRIGVGVAIRHYTGGGPTSECMPSQGSYLLYVVVKYDPKGNSMKRDAYLENVRPPKGR